LNIFVPRISDSRAFSFFFFVCVKAAWPMLPQAEHYLLLPAPDYAPMLKM
jgi:hypothetical protein